MTENDKNDLKVPLFDNLNMTLSRDTRIKVWTQSVKCVSLSRFDMKDSDPYQDWRTMDHIEYWWDTYTF